MSSLTRVVLLNLLLGSTSAIATTPYTSPVIAFSQETGSTAVYATQSPEGMTALRLRAFDRTIELNQADLELFRGFRASGVLVLGSAWGDMKIWTFHFFSNEQDIARETGRFVSILSDGTYYVGKSLDEHLDKIPRPAR